MDFWVLGSVGIRDDRLVGLRAQLVRALVALLLLNANRPVPLGSLLVRMWEGGDPPEDGVSSHVTDLRRALGRAFGDVAAVPRACGGTLRVEVNPVCVDHLRFHERLVEARLEGEPGRVVVVAWAASSEWRGHVLQDLDGDRLWGGRATP